MGDVERFFDDVRRYYDLVDLFLPSPPPGRDRPIDYDQPGSRQTTADIREVGKNNFLAVQGELSSLFVKAEKLGRPPTAAEMVAAGQRGFDSFTEKMEAYRVAYGEIVRQANEKAGPDEQGAKYFQSIADDLVGFLKDGSPDGAPHFLERVVRVLDDPPGSVRARLRRDRLSRNGLRLASVVTSPKDLAEALAYCDPKGAKALLSLVPEKEHAALLAEAAALRDGTKKISEGTRIDSGPALSTQLEAIMKDVEKKYRFPEAAMMPELIPLTAEAGRRLSGGGYQYKAIVNLHIVGEVPDPTQLARLEIFLRARLSGQDYALGQVTFKPVPAPARH